MARARLATVVTVGTLGVSALACDLNLEPFVESSDGGPRIGESARDGGRDAAGGASPDGAPPDGGTSDARKIVFVTSETYNGSLGGVAGADKKCKDLATAANLPGQFIAWLSVEASPALARLTSEGPWQLVGPEPASDRLVFPSKAAITTVGPALPIHRTETGATVTGSVWSGTKADGKVGGPFSCSSFSAASFLDNGMAGSAEKKTKEWTEAGSAGCDAKRRLYCFEL